MPQPKLNVWRNAWQMPRFTLVALFYTLGSSLLQEEYDTPTLSALTTARASRMRILLQEIPCGKTYLKCLWLFKFYPESGFISSSYYQKYFCHKISLSTGIIWEYIHIQFIHCIHLILNTFSFFFCFRFLPPRIIGRQRGISSIGLLHGFLLNEQGKHAFIHIDFFSAKKVSIKLLLLFLSYWIYNFTQYYFFLFRLENCKRYKIEIIIIIIKYNY